MVRLLLIVFGVLIGAPSIAVAQPVDAPKAQAAMRAYFDGEIEGGYVLAGMGVAGLVAGGLLYRRDQGTSRGAAYPLLGIGVVHLAAGIYIGIASDRRIETFDREIAEDAGGFVERERSRMKGVSTSFTMLKVAEVVLIAGGLTMVGIGHRTDRPRLKGAGITLAIEAALTLGFDVVAAKRAMRYREGLDGAHVAVMYEPERGVHGAGIAYGGRF
jgi:hypothetical protein